MSYRLIQVGTGGQGRRWCAEFLQPAMDAGRIEPVAAADVDPEALDHARTHLGLSDDRLFTDPQTAFETVEADCCAIVVPPWHHEAIVDLAVEHGVHIISEKPIAETLDAAVQIADKVDRAGLTMGVTMSHRFDRDKRTLRDHIRRDSNGPLDYLVGRFTCALRTYGDWGAFRHDIDDPLLVEGAVHQLDFLADMAGGTPTTLYADTWRPEWAEYEGDCQGLVEFRTDDGVRVQWEGAKANATSLNCWGNDYVRAECRDATLILDGRRLTRSPLGGDDERMPLRDDGPWMNVALVDAFLGWLDGGEPMETNVRDNLQSMALVEAAILSSRESTTIDVQSLLENATAGW